MPDSVDRPRSFAWILSTVLSCWMTSLLIGGSGCFSIGSYAGLTEDDIFPIPDPQANFSVHSAGLTAFAKVGDSFPTDPDDENGWLDSVRWNWENDGVWDTPWLTDHYSFATHKYPDAGEYDVRLQVQNFDGVTSDTVRRVRVQRAGHPIVVQRYLRLACDPGEVDSFRAGVLSGDGNTMYLVTEAADSWSDSCLIEWSVADDEVKNVYTYRMAGLNTAALSRDETRLFVQRQGTEITNWNLDDFTIAPIALKHPDLNVSVNLGVIDLAAMSDGEHLAALVIQRTGPNYISYYLAKIRISDGSEVGRVELGSAGLPRMAYAGNVAYVAQGTQVFVIDLQQVQILTHVELNDWTSHIAVSQDQTHLFVASSVSGGGAGKLITMRTRDLSIVRQTRLEEPTLPESHAALNDALIGVAGDYVYAVGRTSWGHYVLMIVDPLAGLVVDAVPLEWGVVFKISYDQAHNRVYLFAEQSVWVLTPEE